MSLYTPSLPTLNEQVAYVIDGRTGEHRKPTTQSGYKMKQSSSKFIRGPIPISWIAKASLLPKCGLVMALAVVYCWGFKRQNKFVLSPARVKELRIARSTASRGLKALEKVGLLQIHDRSQGRAPVVEILMWGDVRSANNAAAKL